MNFITRDVKKLAAIIYISIMILIIAVYFNNKTKKIDKNSKKTQDIDENIFTDTDKNILVNTNTQTNENNQSNQNIQTNENNQLSNQNIRITENNQSNKNIQTNENNQQSNQNITITENIQSNQNSLRDNLSITRSITVQNDEETDNIDIQIAIDNENEEEPKIFINLVDALDMESQILLCDNEEETGDTTNMNFMQKRNLIEELYYSKILYAINIDLINWEFLLSPRKQYNFEVKSFPQEDREFVKNYLYKNIVSSDGLSLQKDSLPITEEEKIKVNMLFESIEIDEKIVQAIEKFDIPYNTCIRKNITPFVTLTSIKSYTEQFENDFAKKIWKNIEIYECNVKYPNFALEGIEFIIKEYYNDFLDCRLIDEKPFIINLEKVILYKNEIDEYLYNESLLSIFDVNLLTKLKFEADPSYLFSINSIFEELGIIIPEFFLDGITNGLMKDPIHYGENSNMIIDRSTLERIRQDKEFYHSFDSEIAKNVDKYESIIELKQAIEDFIDKTHGIVKKYLIFYQNYEKTIFL